MVPSRLFHSAVVNRLLVRPAPKHHSTIDGMSAITSEISGRQKGGGKGVGVGCEAGVGEGGRREGWGRKVIGRKGRTAILMYTSLRRGCVL